MKRPPPRFNPTKHDYIDFEGGYDTQTPPLTMPKGRCRLAQNYEAMLLKGYARIGGYERFDGRPKPSAALYSILTATITGSYTVGDTLTGATSGATGVIIAAESGYFVLTKVVGIYAAAENLQVGGTTRAIALATQTQGAASNPQLNAQYLNLAADQYRALIIAVPGSGDVLGVWLYNDVLYAWRNNTGGTAAVMHKQSAAGWVAVAMGRSVAFTSGGTVEILAGQTITGATSAATAVITRVMLESGSWAAGSAAGRLLFATQVGTFVAENLDVGASLNVATIAANGAAITLLPGGRYEFENANFGGSASTHRMYGVDGVNRGFEFDGTVYSPITTGMTLDTPTHLTIHKKHLFYAFGASVQHSGPGTPYQWTILSGAGELALGDTVTGFMSQPGSSEGGALSIFTRNRISVLYGSAASGDGIWNLVDYDKDAGAYAYTIQKVGITIMMDDRGLTSLQTSANYGNFVYATLTQQIQDWINGQRTKSKASCVIREKGQYRIFFTDTSALYVTFDGKKIRGMMPILFVDAVSCCMSAEMNDGSEVAFFGSTNGFVYQMDKGTSFDGASIEAYLHLALNHAATPRTRKRYKHGLIEVSGDGYAEFSVSAELSYGSTEEGPILSRDVVTNFTAPFWDEFTWDEFTWDGKNLTPSEFTLEGTSEHIGLKIYSNSDYFGATSLRSAIIDYSERRRMR